MARPWNSRFCDKVVSLYEVCYNYPNKYILYLRYTLPFRWNYASLGIFIALTLSWPAGHICPTYKESFQVRWDNSIPLFLHAAIYLEVSLFSWTSQNAFSRETAVYKWYCVQCCTAHSIICTRENAFWLVQRNRDTLTFKNRASYI
jgi:hypothetical protein